jgi:hypothetical protein
VKYLHFRLLSGTDIGSAARHNHPHTAILSARDILKLFGVDLHVGLSPLCSLEITRLKQSEERVFKDLSNTRWIKFRCKRRITLVQISVQIDT